MRTTRIATLASAGCAVLLAGTAVLLGVAAAPHTDIAALVLMAVAIVTTAGVAALIGFRVPGHAIGLILGAAALLYSTGFAAESYARFTILDHHDLPAADLAVLWADASWAAMFAGVVAVALVFPDGRLLSARWRPVALAATVSVAGTVLLGLFGTEPFDRPFQDVERPLPALPDTVAVLEVVFFAGLAATVLAAGVAARRRFVRAGQPQRQQLLWLAASAWLVPVTLAVCIADAVVSADLDWLVLTSLLVTITGVPASIAVAVLRYRLYDLERLVNRALVYGLLTALVFAASYLTALALGGLAVEGESLAVLLVVTAVVVIGVNPARVRLQRRVDRLMYGDRADPYAGLTRLAARLESSVTPQMALRTIVDTVADSLKVPFVAVDLRRADGVERAAVHGAPASTEPVRVPLAFQGEEVGSLVVGARPGEALTAADRQLLTELSRHAGAVVHATRLTHELQESRERLVTAQEDVRRRLRRDLHDGLGPALASAVFQVDLARDALPPGSGDVDARLEVLRKELQQAVDSIRAMAYALRPPALDTGLLPAIAEQVSSHNARGAGPHLTLSAPPVLPALPPAVEVAAYRITMEAVANAARHSGARSCAIRVCLNGGLEIEVADDGALGDGRPFRPGVGITSMRERAQEVGALLTIDQGPFGTRVRTVLPVGAS